MQAVLRLELELGLELVSLKRLGRQGASAGSVTLLPYSF